MSFLNAILLWGLTAMVIPFVIHLYRRQRHVVVRWGAMRFLADAVHRRRHTIRIEQWLLVAVRMAIIGALALACARPAIQMSDVGAFRGRRDVTIIADVSYSTAYGGRAEKIRAAALEIIDSLEADDTVTLVAAGPSPRLVFPTASAGAASDASDHAACRAAVEALEPDAGRADFEAAVRFALRSASIVSGAGREIWIASDAQKLNWSEREANSIHELVDRAGPEAKAAIGWVAVRGETSGAETPYLAGIDLPSYAVVGETIAIRIAVVARDACDDATLVVDIGGVTVGERHLSLKAGERLELVLRHALERSGATRLEAKLVAGADVLDRRWHAVVVVHAETPLLVFDGDRGDGLLESETAFLALALGANGSDAPDRAYRIEYADVAELESREFGEFDCIVLADVETVSSTAAGRLESWVEAGGGLVVFAGDRVDAASYRRTLFRRGAGLLPCPPGRVRTSEQGAGVKLSAAGQRLFEDFDESAFEGVRVTRWLELDCASRASPESPTEVILATEDGEPLIVERGLDRGRVIASATSCDDSWTNLPLRWVNVPLVRGLVARASFAAGVPRTLATGSPLFASWRVGDGARNGDATVSLRLPDGTALEGLASVANGRATFQYRDTALQGVYVATASDGTEEVFAFNAARDESELDELGEGHVERLAVDLGAELARDGESLRRTLTEKRYGVEVWRPLAGLALGLAFAELLLLRWIQRRAPLARAVGSGA